MNEERIEPAGRLLPDGAAKVRKAWSRPAMQIESIWDVTGKPTITVPTEAPNTVCGPAS